LVTQKELYVDILNQNELKGLSKEQDGWHVSIFMPTHRTGAEIQQDPIRLKNLLGQAKERLTAAGLRTPEAETLLEPASGLIQDGLFWQRQSDGLAIFASSKMARHYRLPLDFEELVVVADRFHIKPLLPLLSGDGRFYLLALSQAEVRLLQGSRYSVSEVDLGDAPASMAETLRFDDPERRLQFHTASGPSGGEGSRRAMFHGLGAPSEDDKGAILRYFQEIDAALQDLLAGEQAPLVLAGVDYLLPIYQEANSYRFLMEDGVVGNPDDLSAKELHQRAWTIVQPRFDRERREAESHFRQAAGTDQASDELVEVVPAAHHGRVDTLFVTLGHQQWGTFDPATNEVDVHQDPEAVDNDLLDTAAVQTLLNGGTVYAVQREQMPAETYLAALLRY
jgi:hypothetical protein